MRVAALLYDTIHNTEFQRGAFGGILHSWNGRYDREGYRKVTFFAIGL